MPAASIARVLIDSPLPQLDRLFDYRIPAGQIAQARVGSRVRVPLRSAKRVADGFIVELVSSVEYEGVLSELESVVSAVPVLAPEVYELARKVADRAAGGASDIVRIAVPKRQVRVEKAWLASRGDMPGPSELVPVAVADYGTAEIDHAIANSARLAVEAIP